MLCSKFRLSSRSVFNDFARGIEKGSYVEPNWTRILNFLNFPAARRLQVSSSERAPNHLLLALSAAGKSAAGDDCDSALWRRQLASLHRLHGTAAGLLRGEGDGSDPIAETAESGDWSGALRARVSLQWGKFLPSLFSFCCIPFQLDARRCLEGRIPLIVAGERTSRRVSMWPSVRRARFMSALEDDCVGGRFSDRGARLELELLLWSCVSFLSWGKVFP